MNNEENEIKSKLAVHTETHCRKSDFKPHFQFENVVQIVFYLSIYFFSLINDCKSHFIFFLRNEQVC